MLIEHGVFVPGELCARYGVALEQLIVAQLRRDGAAMPPDLAQLLGDLVAAGRRWREANQLVAEHSGTAGIPTDEGTVILDRVNTTAAAAVLGTSTRNVRALAGRGSIPARKSGGGWCFDPLDLAVFNESRQAS